MEQKTDNKKKIVKVVIWAIVILALMGTMHIIVNNIDGLEIIRQLHGDRSKKTPRSAGESLLSTWTGVIRQRIQEVFDSPFLDSQPR
ncbi:hypothetical protein [Candidatus Villigracilis affinis]|uniref:hypothetical protein n=1 Tax=Candidatus Villigracilis affinis TaxID=3140682 RepID=UPI002A1EAFCD|nr:hypothetical protein [Anaerolineales bacterium]